MNALQKLSQNMVQSLACAGIDPDPRKIPGGMGQNGETLIFDYLTGYIDAVAPHICGFKAQKAFFDGHGGGHDLLKETVRYVHDRHPHLPVILDCKVGDIGNTMTAYMDNIFGKLNCDGVLVNPYMGDDVFEQVADYPGKIIGVLAKTSNPAGGIVQDQILANGSPLWMHVLDLSMNRWNKAGNIVPILSAVDDRSLLVQARQMVPQDMPILFAGVGAQGRDEMAIRYLLNQEKSGVFVNSSRGLMYPETHADERLAQAQARSAAELKDKLESLRQVPAKLTPHFLFMGGVSGVGKTTIMQELKKLDPRFTYISPETTRPLRPGETDKTSIPLEQMEQREAAGEYLTVNRLNSVLYGTPKGAIHDAFNRQAFPMLDFPIDRHDVIHQFTDGRVYTVYVRPPSLGELATRLSYDGRDASGQRYASAKHELERYSRGEFNPVIDMDVVSETGHSAEIARKIYAGFINHTLEK